MNQQRQLELSELVGRRLGGCADPFAYLEFLRSQSRMYKYTFWQQVFIFAQNPNATAAATFDQWNKNVRRRIRPGSRGIAIPDPQRDNQMRYVFDIRDTYATAQSRPVLVWQYQERYAEAVTAFLHNAYDSVPAEGHPTGAFYKASRAAVLGRTENDETFDRFLPMLGEDTELALELVQLSVYYEVLNRCGLEPREHYDFSILNRSLTALMDGLTPQEQADRVYALGCLTGTVAAELLRGIEYTVKQEMQKERQNERADLPQRSNERHESVPAQPHAGREGRAAAAGPLGAGAPEVPGPDESVRAVPDSGDAVQAPGGSPESGRGDGTDAQGQPDEAGADSRPAAPAPGVGEVHGQPPEPGGRDGAQRADSGVRRQQRRRRSSALEGQIQLAMEETPVGVPQEVFDEVLRLGSNERNSVQRILANHQLGNADFAEFLRNEFLASGHEGGRGIVLGREPYAVWFEQEGIRIARGNTVRSADSVLFTWQEAAAEIDDLIHTGAYAPAEAIDDAIPQMRLEAAQSIWYLHQDLAQGTQFFLDNEFFDRKGFPESTQQIADLLDDPLYLAQVLQGLRMFAAELRDNPDLLRFHIAAHSPERIRRRLELLQNEPTFYPSVIREHEVPAFITEDEIDDTLRRGSNYSQSRQKIYKFFSEHTAAKERANFIKAHYGIGGSSHSVSHADNSFLDYDSSGMVMRRGDQASIKLKWNAVAKRIDALIQAGRYLTQEELTELEEREESQALAEESEQEVNAAEEEADEPDPAKADFLSGDLNLMDGDLRYCLTSSEGLMPLSDKQRFAGWVQAGLTNGQLAQRLGGLYHDIAEGIELDTGEDAEYYADRVGFRVEIQDKYLTVRSESWVNLVPYLRAMAEQELDGFVSEAQLEKLAEQRAAEREAQDAAMEQADEEDFSEPEDAEEPEQAEIAETKQSEPEQAEIAETEQREPQHTLQPLTREAGNAYAEVKAQHPIGLVGFEQHGYYEFYNDDARIVADLLGTDILNKVVEDGNDIPVTGIPVDAAIESLRSLWMDGNDIYLTRLEGDQLVELKHYLASEVVPAGTVLTMPAMSGPGTVEYTVQNVDFDEHLVLLSVGESLHMLPLEMVRHYYEEQMEPAPFAIPQESAEPEFPYAVGDTVWLEDGTAYVIENIGLFDVQLRDPTLAYSILRAESKENLLRLVERYPQQEGAAEPELPQESTQTFTTEPVETYPGRENGLPYDIVIERLHIEPEPTPTPEPTAEPTTEPVTEPEPEVAATPDPVVSNVEERQKDRSGNYRIIDNRLGEGGPKAKYEANVTAIRLLKTLEAENRPATPEEQEQLSRYVGWGGVPDAFDERKAAWSAEFQELKELLSPAEYKAARESVLNSHYTSPTVIRAIYDAVQGMGFEGGRILEPSMGVGNFFGLLPEALSSSELYGVELDSITGRIAQKLYPEAHIKVAGFETTKKRDFYDLAVGNVPFGQYQVHDVDYNRLGFNIHNYFFAKALDQVRPGGVVAFVTSRFTMDAQSTQVRRYLAERAELLGAIRLPNNAFRANAGTDVVSDILFLQRRDEIISLDNQRPAWVETAEVSEGVTVNRYFAEHPEMVLGTLELESTRYGQDVTCTPIPGAELSEQLREAVSYLPKDIYVEEAIAVEDIAELPPDDVIDADENVRNFSYTLVGDEVYYREKSPLAQC